MSPILPNAFTGVWRNSSNVTRYNFLQVISTLSNCFECNPPNPHNWCCGKWSAGWTWWDMWGDGWICWGGVLATGWPKGLLGGYCLVIEGINAAGCYAWQSAAAFGSEKWGERAREGERGSVIDPVALAWAAVITKPVLCALCVSVYVCITDNSCKYLHLECLYPGD